MTPETFKTIRTDAGLSTALLSERIGVCERTIRRYERGVCPIPKPISMLMHFLRDGLYDTIQE